MDIKQYLEKTNTVLITKEAFECLKERVCEWIPVSERLPEDGTWAIFTDGSSISVERYKADALDHFYPQGRWFLFENTTAWMPLPKPYKAESEEV